MLQSETLPEDKRDALLQAFSELPQRVLWKWEADNLPGQPKNVRIESWCPQLDILSKIIPVIFYTKIILKNETYHIERKVPKYE